MSNLPTEPSDLDLTLVSFARLCVLLIEAGQQGDTWRAVAIAFEAGKRIGAADEAERAGRPVPDHVDGQPIGGRRPRPRSIGGRS